jgi:hypothetical protein
MGAPQPLRIVFAAAVTWVVAYELYVVFAPGFDAGVLFSRGAHDIVLLVAAAVALTRAVRAAGRTRLAWALIGAGVLAWALGELFYTAVLWDESDPPIPSLADAGFLLFPVLVLAGALLLLPRDLPRRRWVDGLIAALAVSAVSAALVFDTVLASVEGRPLAGWASRAI